MNAPPLLGIFLGVLFFGLISVALGQDVNWDLQNYHRYNPWAFLNGRIGHDLAPASMETYFNPAIDLPYHWMTDHLPPRVTAFLLGSMHGLNLLLLWAIARNILKDDVPHRVPVLLAFAGCLGATFLAGLANTMGDNLAALPILAALLVLLRALPTIESGRSFGISAGLGAGVLTGLGVGVKLTNAPYAIGLAVALFWALRGWRGPNRLRAAVAVSSLCTGVLLGVAIGGGYWHLQMWQQFGNPLFPQFNSIFRSDMALEGMAGDTRWGPRRLWEWLMWPFVFTLNPGRFNETPLIQLLWPLAYGLSIIWLLRALGTRLLSGKCTACDTEEKSARQLFIGPIFVLVFSAVSYFVWLAVFSVGRYMIVVELLLPLIVWIVWSRAVTPRSTHRWAAAFITVAVTISVGRFANHGHAGWTDAYYSVPVPAIAEPGRSTVLVLATPSAWVLPDFPAELVFMTINHPRLRESEGYRRRVDAILAERTGSVYAIVMAGRDPLVENIEERLNRSIADYGIRSDGWTCNAISWGLRKISTYRQVLKVPGGASGLCAFAVPEEQRRDLSVQDRNYAHEASSGIASHNLSIDPKDCKPLRAYMGTKPFPFQFCEVKRQQAGPALPV
ncbi:MAG: hypothetical protein PGN26_03705 [Xylophilus ampelinus]